MSRPLDAYDGIAIAELIFYLFALGGGITLCIRHGFTKNAGWRGLIVLALARVVGACLRLATISSPSNVNLYIGWLTINGIGLAPLLLLVLGLLSRIFDSINRQGHVFVQNKHQRLIELLLLLAIILLIVGGTQSTFTIVDGGPKATYSTASHAAVGIFCAVVALVILEIFIAATNQGYVAQGEHRIIIAVILSMPFIIVRLIYSCLLLFAGLTSTPWLYLGLSSIMEMVVTVITEVMGFTLDKSPPMSVPQEDEEMQGMRK